MDNTIEGDPKNTVMKKALQILRVVLPRKRINKSW